MSMRSLWLHVVLCVAALAFAWRSAHQVTEKKGGPSSTVLLDVAPGDVESVSYKWDKGTSSVVSAGKEKSRAVVVTLDREVAKKAKKEPKKKDPHGHDDEEKAPEAIEAPAEREAGTFPGGKPVVTALEALEPLKTKRSLGVVDAIRLKAMGLDAPVRELVIKAKGKELVLELGEQSYGAQGRYARVKGQQEVHLIDAAIVTGLEGSIDTMLEKRVLTAELDDIDGYSVSMGDKGGTYVHVDKSQPSKQHFAKDGTKDEAAGKLMTTLRNLRGTKLAAAEAAEKAGAAVAVFSVSVDDKPVRIEILERTDAEGHLARVGKWTYEITATVTKELIGDVEAL